MGDASKTLTNKEGDISPPQESLDALHPAKPSENFVILSKSPTTSEEKLEKIHETDIISSETVQNVIDIKSETDKVESKVINQDTDNTEKNEDELMGVQKVSTSAESGNKTIESTLMPTALDRKPRGGSLASGLNQSERVVRNQSDIFSLKEQTTVASSIFSINGSPSRKLFRKKEVTANTVIPFGHVSTEPPSDKASSKDRSRDRDSYNDIKRPSSSLRNPLTGTGLSSNDEYKFKVTKRKDGNPLLGLGYSPEITPSTHRIPPGGYSHKLW